MDENLTLPPVAMLDDAGGNHVTPFSQDEIAQAEAKIGQMVALPDGPSPRLKTRMNPEGLAPRDGMGFGENVAGQLRSGSIAGVISESADLQSVQTGGANMANRGFTEGQLRQLPSRVRERIQAEEAALTPDQKQERLAKVEARVFEQAAYDLSQGNLSIASAGGAIAAGVLSPENFLIGLPNAARGAVSGFIASKLPSARPAIQAALVSGVDAAFGNVIIDPVLQASRVQAGAQDKYDVTQTLLAAPVGLAAGAAIRGGVDALTGANRAAAPAADAAAPTVEARAPDAMPEAPAPRVADAETPRVDPPSNLIAYHGSPNAKSINSPLRPSEGGELGAGVYFSREAEVAKGYAQSRVSEAGGVIELDMSQMRIKEITQKQWVKDRAEIYARLEREAGGWSKELAKVGEAELEQRYKAEGFDGIYATDTRQGVIFKDRAAKVARRSEQPAEAPDMPRAAPAEAAGGDVARPALLGAELPRMPAHSVTTAAGNKVDVAPITEAQGQSGLFDGGRGGVSGNAQTLRAEGQGRSVGEGGGTPEVLALGKQRSNGVRNVIARIKGEDVTARPQGDVLPMAQRQALPQPVDTPFVRQVLDGETQKPFKLPDGAGPEEVHSFRVTEAIGDLAAQLGRKVEVDGRFTIKGAAGEYKLKDGVIRIRQAGDFEAFAHEAGHAIDQDLSRLFSDDWKALLKAHEAELTKLDTNVGDDAAKTLVEGTAEFMRAYVTNPAYARKNMAPQFAAAFDRFIAEKAPGLGEWFVGAQRASQIDSGMAPTQRMETMQVSQIEPGRWKQFRDTWKKEGLPIAFRDVWDQFSQAVSGRDQAVYRFVDSLKDARFAKTGEAGQAFYKWADPYTTFRQLSGAEQGALDMIWNGVRPYGQMGRAIDRSSPSLHDSIKLAVGRVENISDPDNQAVRAFNGYLIARRAAALYDRYEAGDLRSPPIRASKAEALKAIADYEAANPQFKQAADGVFQFARASLERKRDAGLVSQEMFDAIVAKSPTGEYVPFYRDMQDLKAGGSGGAGSASMERQAIKAMGGSTRDILDPLQSLMMDAIRTERLIAKNDFVRSLHMLAQQGGELGGRFVERIPNSEMKATSVDLMEAVRQAAKERGLEKADAEIMVRQMEEMIGEDTTATTFKNVETTARGERIMFYWDGGERVALKVGNDKYSKQFFDLMSDMGQAERDLMMGMFGKANAYFTQAITNAPQFGIKNLIMDGITRMFVARNAGAMGRVPFAPLMAGVYSTIFDREFAKAFEALGGMKGGPAAAAVREVTPASGFAGIAEKPKGWRGIADEFVRDQGSWSNVAIGVVKSPVTLVKGMVHVIEATETIGRVGQAKLVYNHLLKNGASDAEAMRGALFESRDILDYDRFGQATTAARRFMPFLNANIQGTSTANQRLLTDPARAIAQWNERGRDWAKVDEDLKTAFTDGLLNWGMIAAGVAMTASYWASMKDNETYQRASSYMKRRYFIVPLPGSGEGGDANYLSIPKPFDLPGAAMSAMEMALDGMARANPDMMEQVSKALADGFIPRMVSGMDEFLGSMPHLKTGYELTLGRTLPFEGSKPRDIVPQALRSLPADQQFTGNTSWLAKKVGEVWGLSPVKVDHAINGLFATAGRDVNDALTASFDNNPNMTQQDAFTKMFFGGLYRRQRGVGSPNNAIHQAMGQDGGKYVVAANGYRKFVESGDTVNADKAFNQADELTKTVMTFRGHNFSPAERQLHPLEHAEVVAQISGSLSRDLAQNMVQVQDRSRKRGEVRGRIEVDSQTARALTTAINSWAAEGILSGLVIAGVPGYQTGKVIDPSERLKYIKALSPQVGEELEKRIEKAHLVPLPHIAEKWDEVKRRLSQDRDAAKFTDLVPAGVKLPKNRR